MQQSEASGEQSLTKLPDQPELIELNLDELEGVAGGPQIINDGLL